MATISLDKFSWEERTNLLLAKMSDFPHHYIMSEDPIQRFAATIDVRSHVTGRVVRFELWSYDLNFIYYRAYNETRSYIDFQLKIQRDLII